MHDIHMFMFLEFAKLKIPNIFKTFDEFHVKQPIMPFLVKKQKEIHYFW